MRGRRGRDIGVARQPRPTTTARLLSVSVVEEADHVRVVSAVNALSARGRGRGGRSHGHSRFPTSVTKTSADFPDVGKFGSVFGVDASTITASSTALFGLEVTMIAASSMANMSSSTAASVADADTPPSRHEEQGRQS